VRPSQADHGAACEVLEPSIRVGPAVRRTVVSVLSDHKKSGKRLVPPFIHMLGGLEEVSWIKQGLPEYLWLALIHDNLGDRSAVEAVSSLARICRQSQAEHEHHTFAATSSYLRVLPRDAARIRELLATRGILFELQSSLRFLLSTYPSCPLGWLFSELPDSDLETSLALVRRVVSKLYDRSDLLCTKIQATVVYLAFDAGVLKVRTGLSLAQFPENRRLPTHRHL
jgi:hypothetical protein